MKPNFSIGVYPGSFNPFHVGHADIVKKALKVFDFIVILRMFNPEKKYTKEEEKEIRGNACDYTRKIKSYFLVEDRKRISVKFSAQTLKYSLAERWYVHGKKFESTAVIRGLRNGHDLQYEMNSQYWNEDVGIKIPFVYFITDRKLSHVSSSSIKMVEKLNLEHKYCLGRDDEN